MNRANSKLRDTYTRGETQYSDSTSSILKSKKISEK